MSYRFKTPEEIDEMLAQKMREIGSWFKKGMVMSLIIRHPTDPEAEWFVSNEPNPSDYSDLLAAIKRSQDREMLIPGSKP